MISGLYLKQLIRGTEYGEENVADGKRQDSILDIRFESAANHGIALSGTLLHMENRDRSA